MLGNPEFQKGDTVSFRFEDDGHTLEGTGVIAQVDPNGCFMDDSDVCYDIIVREEKYVSEVNKYGECCYKHVNEGSITKLVKKA